MPATIRLPALQRAWRVQYAKRRGAYVRITETDATLRVSGPIGDKRLVCRALRRWLARLARVELVRRLDVLCAGSGLAYTRCSIRGQQGRWGSGSTSGNLNLNYKLLFLDPGLVDYVLLHELAHTRYPDHSRRFWRELQRLLPDCRARHAALQEAGAEVPWWAEHG